MKEEGFTWLHYDVNFTGGYVSGCFGELDCLYEEFFRDWWVEADDVENNEFTVFIFYVVKPLEYRVRIFPLVHIRCLYHLFVDFV